MKEARDEAVWSMCRVGSREGGRNARRDEVQARHPREEGSDDHASTTGSSSGKSSDDSSVTSPVLSTSTLQTTPSPPPPGDRKDQPLMRRPVTIAVDPVLNPPKLLHTIPHVPVTAAHLPNYSLEAFKGVWERKPCNHYTMPGVASCERAMAQKAQAAAAAAAGPQAQYDLDLDQKDQADSSNQTLLRIPPQMSCMRVADEVLTTMYEVTSWNNYEDEYEILDETTPYPKSHSDNGQSRAASTKTRDLNLTQGQFRSPQRGPVRRRWMILSSHKHTVTESDRDTSYHHRGEPGTPPKRPRVLSPTLLPSPDLHDKYELQNSPSRLRKRSSEDLGRNDVEHGKRIKMSGEEEDSGSGDSPPRSISMSVTAEESDDVGDENVGVVRVGLAPNFGAATVPRSATPQDKVISNGGLVPPPPPVAKRKIPLPGQGRKRANVDDDQ
ncbi:hypothetical protein VNI00_013297 [Paramarasmius palmivorus]|uniref:Uncharacterized protein n=1 Tax=Paramarasmius palmivorus TaxID=297713 RepID=A0AAW0BZP9_9AGAR